MVTIHTPVHTRHRSGRDFRPTHLTEDQLRAALDAAPDSGGYRMTSARLRQGDTLQANGATFVGPAVYDMIRFPDGTIVVESR